MLDLPTIWLLIIGLQIGLYIILDGADLGIGVLSLFARSEQRRSLMMHVVGPIWDANETWLVIAAGTLFGAFPLAYGIIFNALYIPAFIILFGIMLRAVSFEFRNHGNRHFWGVAFGVGSLLTVLGQGFAAGGLLGGIATENGSFAGGPWDWLSPLTFFMTIGVVMSYVVVGFAYLIKKTDISEKGFFAVLVGSFIAFAGFFLSTLLLPEIQSLFLERWTTMPTAGILLALSAAIGGVSLVLLWAALHHRLERYLHYLCMSIFALAMLGILVGAYPYIIPPSITIYDAAASDATLTFMLWGIGPLLPIIFAYNFYLYRVFSRDLEPHRKESY